MCILSFSQEHDAGAAVIENGKVLAAINEERLTRVKGQDGFPINSIQEVLKLSGKVHTDVKHVVVPEISKFIDVVKNVTKYPATAFPVGKGSPSLTDVIRQALYASYIILQTYPKVIWNHFVDIIILKRMFPDAQFHRVEHHVCHAASAFHTSGFSKALVVTADYWGDFVCNMVSIGERKQIRPVSRSWYPNSIGHYYANLTTWMGFKANRHEGKILGLAAYGDAESPAYDEIKDLLVVDGLKIYCPFMIGRMWHKKLPFFKNSLMRRLQRTYSREEIAAVFQRRLEEVFVELVRNAYEKYKIGNLVLAGGTFSNVKLNQRLFQIKGIKKIYIFPNMTDGGISVGAALHYDISSNGSLGSAIDDAYLGPGFSNAEIEEELEQAKVNYEYFKNVEKEIAKLLADNKVVARFNGKMEYGPRALGNRSILYAATDPSVNDWLNKKLGRTEFMPFAPVTLAEYAEECYENIKGAEYPAKFMTITFDCTDYMKKASPATVHVDGTARPQLIDEKTNPSYYKILKEYHKITGIPTIVNTSFNMHEEPIVCTPNDAVRSFLCGHLEYLAIGNFLVTNSKA
ncbi:carbamoyltransferase [bacterium]|nr:carbamoyltransferase [bacterium]